MKQHLCYRRGSVELIELLFVTILLGTIGLAMYFSLLFSQRSSQRARHYTRASQVVSQQIETLRTTPYADITVPYDDTFTTDPGWIGILPNSSTNLSVQWDDASQTIKRAVATVYWVENSLPRQLSYTTLIVSQGNGQ